MRRAAASRFGLCGARNERVIVAARRTHLHVCPATSNASGTGDELFGVVRPVEFEGPAVIGSPAADFMAMFAGPTCSDFTKTHFVTMIVQLSRGRCDETYGMRVAAHLGIEKS